eukprot:CAMPEP_0195066240 /NCGR_PEP_ID=MMETSP0448-20130528/11643_1 /TAXON_ID=66468 /ORGANISM="Heterocapsa triquestra, Strain CCMP 448" /LENGTH=71 /DNA_ID=CAMNT_0040097453 /DNA_START=33 /DNA_END=244 /DNA_ORIENTATION=+
MPSRLRGRDTLGGEGARQTARRCSVGRCAAREGGKGAGPGAARLRLFRVAALHRRHASAQQPQSQSLIAPS